MHVAGVDVAEVEKFKFVLEQLPPEFQRIDILINNAGLALTYDTIEESEWVTSIFCHQSF